MYKKEHHDTFGAYGSSEFLCGVCSRSLTESCYNCGPVNYWQRFEPRLDAIENPPEFPSLKKWHDMGYGESSILLGFIYVFCIRKPK
jgi:hypothetical protein